MVLPWSAGVSSSQPLPRFQHSVFGLSSHLRSYCRWPARWLFVPNDNIDTEVSPMHSLARRVLPAILLSLLTAVSVLGNVNPPLGASIEVAGNPDAKLL